MAEITTTQAFSDGDTVTATKLNNITANAALQTEAITNRSAETTVDQANDLLLMYDASATALKKITLSNAIKAGTASNFPVTGNATVGGTLGVTGASTLTGNTTIGGTLGVTGAITASSTINGTTIPTSKTLVTTDETQTLTNKTLTSPAISGGTINNASVGATTPSTGAFTTLSASSTITSAAGTASAPAIVPTGDTNTGLFFPAADTIAFAEGGAEAMRIDSSGNVGIGTTSPARLLTINHSTNPEIGLYTSGTERVKFSTGGSAASQLAIDTGGAERLRITSGGYFKASNSGSYANVAASYHEFVNTANDVGLLVTNNNASLATIGCLLLEAARNTTNNTFYAISYYNNGAGAYKFRVADSGNVTNTNNSYGSISDVKLKQDIADASSQWNDIKSLRVRKYRYKSDPSMPLQIGLVAQEAEIVSAGLIEEHPDYEEVEITDENGETRKERQPTGTSTKAIKYSVLYMKAVKALQEAMERIETLESNNAALESRIAALEAA